MPVFEYKAMDAAGKDMNGLIEAASEKLASARLREMGLRPYQVKEKKEAAGFSIPFLQRGVKTEETTMFTRQMATLLDAGLPLLRALTILQDQAENPKLKELITTLSSDIQSGSSFSDALSKHKRVFQPLYYNMVKAGEIGGVLEKVLNRLAEFAEKEQELRTKVKGAMTYPAVMALVATTVVTFLMIKIIPTFATMFLQMGVALPLPTRVVMTISNFLVGYWWMCILGIIGAIIALNWYDQPGRGRLQCDKVRLKLPVFGDLIKKVAISRFTRTLGTLVASGVPILQAIKIVKDTIGNEVLAAVMDDVSASISQGETISKPLHKSKVFPLMVTHMIAVGEETGSLDSMLTKIADNYDLIVDETVNALSSLIEPLMVVAMGGAIGIIVMAMFFPMFEMINLVK
ncbi:MAG: type II secretion system protein GspF [Candidatus Lindowbacteria bacterium RIFCSPLOWO2_12_FULL_62_27]|nr:MAG: type II secretion system protein GspF [Candidatus Lindowbacteria bacterium RIFCSPLOWO2_12_FULL_62_27]OGH63785.1 MAG: type II secretion system protein GspF [Candidatus Lindowbacteria bacterium RIFCSPLOWO2_02_FULL_62_12]